MLRIRLQRGGKKHAPTYSIVVIESSRPTTGRFVEKLGYYLPCRTPKEVSIKKDRYDYWLSVGAQPSETVAKLVSKQTA